MLLEKEKKIRNKLKQFHGSCLSKTDNDVIKLKQPCPGLKSAHRVNFCYTTIHWPSRIGLQNTPTASLQRNKTLRTTT